MIPHAATVTISARYSSFKILIVEIMTKAKIFVLVGFAVASLWLANAKLCSKSSPIPEDRDKYVYTMANQVRAGNYIAIYITRREILIL